MSAPSSRIAVLIVEDEILIRMMLTDELEDLGLTAIEAGDASEALALLEAHPEVTILFTDINMPGTMSGLELARIVHARRPEIKLYLASGRERPLDCAIPDDGTFIEKPYNASQIAQLLREAA